MQKNTYYSFTTEAGHREIILLLNLMSASTKFLKMVKAKRMALPALVEHVQCYSEGPDGLDVYHLESAGIIDVLKLAPFSVLLKDFFRWEPLKQVRIEDPMSCLRTRSLKRCPVAVW